MVQAGEPPEPPARAPGPPGAYTLRRILRNARWARSQGLARLIEEDQLDPADRLRRAFARWRWRLANRSGERVPATAVLLVGVQRSGTNMLVRGLERAPEFAVYNENSAAAFRRFRLRPDSVIRTLVDSSRHPYVLLKPLCDSHRTPELLDGLGTASPRTRSGYTARWTRACARHWPSSATPTCARCATSRPAGAATAGRRGGCRPTASS
jgi:hypothetical protein